MYLSPVMWMGFLLAGRRRAAATALFPGTDLTVAPAVWERVASGEGVALFATMMAIVFAPKLLGVLDIMLSAGKRRRYGGGVRVLAGTLVELEIGRASCRERVCQYV